MGMQECGLVTVSADLQAVCMLWTVVWFGIGLVFSEGGEGETLQLMRGKHHVTKVRGKWESFVCAHLGTVDRCFYLVLSQRNTVNALIFIKLI